MDVHAVGLHVEGDIRHMQKIIGEVFLDDVALVAAADNELIDAVTGVDLHDMPEDWHAADLHHGFGAHGSFFTQARAQPTCENHCFHVIWPRWGLVRRSTQRHPNKTDRQEAPHAAALPWQYGSSRRSRKHRQQHW